MKIKRIIISFFMLLAISILIILINFQDGDKNLEKLNYSDKAVSKWERDGGYPEVEKLLVLAAKLDISLDALFEDELNYLKKKQPDDFLKKYPGLLAGLQVFIDNLEKI